MKQCLGLWRLRKVNVKPCLVFVQIEQCYCEALI